MKYKNQSNFINDYAPTKESEIIEDYDFTRDEKGNLKIEKIGEHDGFEAVQSYAKSCGLKPLLEQVKLTGNIQLLHQKEKTDGDISNLELSLNPEKVNTTIEELQAKLKALENQIAEAKETTDNGTNQ